MSSNSTFNTSDSLIQASGLSQLAKLDLQDIINGIKREGCIPSMSIVGDVVYLSWRNDKLYIQASITETTAVYIYNGLPQ